MKNVTPGQAYTLLACAWYLNCVDEIRSGLSSAILRAFENFSCDENRYNAYKAHIGDIKEKYSLDVFKARNGLHGVSVKDWVDAIESMYEGNCVAEDDNDNTLRLNIEDGMDRLAERLYKALRAGGIEKDDLVATFRQCDPDGELCKVASEYTADLSIGNDFPGLVSVVAQQAPR